MAVDGDVDYSSAKDGEELEAMLPDAAWHPCQVSLSFTGIGLAVDFGRKDVDNMILDKEEALKQLRIRSIPLQGDDCSRINEGEHVLAARASQRRSLFYDAEVIKAIRVRHSKRIHCRCTFTIKWLQQDGNGGSSTVPSSSILKLSTKCIKDHPAVAAFLSSMNGSNCCVVPPTVLGETEYETNLEIFLEKQIKDIDNVTSESSKKNSEDILLEVEGGLGDSKEQLLRVPDVVPKDSISSLDASHRWNHIERFSPLDMKIEEPKPAAPSIEVKHLENRSHLSPLAARAALASFRSNFPCRLDFSVRYEEEKDYARTVNNPIPKDVATESVQGTGASKSFAKDVSVTFDHSSDAAAVTFAAVTLPNDILEPVKCTGTGGSGRQPHANADSRTLTRGGKKKQKMELAISEASLTCPIMEELRQPVEQTGLTSSEIAIDTDNVKGNGEKKTSQVKMKSGPLTSVRRSMRNAGKEENRSSTMEVRPELEERRLFRFSESTPPQVVSKSNVPKKNTLPDHVWIDSPPNQETTKKRKSYATGEATQETHGEGKVSGTGASVRSKGIPASSSSKKQELRFSHRLKFLPRTRSQNRSNSQ